MTSPPRAPEKTTHTVRSSLKSSKRCSVPAATNKTSPASNGSPPAVCRRRSPCSSVHPVVRFPEKQGSARDSLFWQNGPQDEFAPTPIHMCIKYPKKTCPDANAVYYHGMRRRSHIRTGRKINAENGESISRARQAARRGLTFFWSRPPSCTNLH